MSLFCKGLQGDLQPRCPDFQDRALSRHTHQCSQSTDHVQGLFWAQGTSRGQNQLLRGHIRLLHLVVVPALGWRPYAAARNWLLSLLSPRVRGSPQPQPVSLASRRPASRGSPSPAAVALENPHLRREKGFRTLTAGQTQCHLRVRRPERAPRGSARFVPDCCLTTASCSFCSER